MLIEKQIKQLEKKAIKKRRKMDCYSGKGQFRTLQLKAQKEYYDLIFKIYELLIPYVSFKNEDFKDISKRNFELLKNSTIICKTKRKSWSMHGYYASDFVGRIEKNGLFYCRTQKTNFPIFTLFPGTEFPSRYRGRFDCLGNIKIEVVETSRALFKTLPSTFTGQIDENGVIEIETNKRDSDFILSGKHIVSEIIGAPFGDDSQRIHEFFENRNMLIKILEQYRIEFKNAI